MTASERAKELIDMDSHKVGMDIKFYVMGVFTETDGRCGGLFNVYKQYAIDVEKLPDE